MTIAILEKLSLSDDKIMPKFIRTALGTKLGYKPRSAWYGICIHLDWSGVI